MEAYPHFQQQLADVITDIQEYGFYFADQRKHLLRTLNELEKTSAQAYATHADIGLIHYYIGLISSDEYLGKEEALKRLSTAAVMQQQASFLSMMQQVKLALVLGELHRRFGHDNEAVHYFSLAADLVDDPSTDPDLRIGALQSVAYHYHEMEMYQQALGLNLAARYTCVEHFPEEWDAELPLLQNLAENTYCLGEFALTEKYLHQVVEYAVKLEDEEVEVNGLFKLGVLAFEQSETDTARDYLQQSLQAAKRSGDDELIAMAQANLKGWEARRGQGGE